MQNYLDKWYFEEARDEYLKKLKIYKNTSSIPKKFYIMFRYEGLMYWTAGSLVTAIIDAILK